MDFEFEILKEIEKLKRQVAYLRRLEKGDTDLSDYALDADVVHDTGNETIAGIKTFSSIPVLPASDPTADNQAVRKAYVDYIWTNYTPTVTWDGGTTDPTTTTVNSSRYCQVGEQVTYHFNLSITRGSGDRTTTGISLPVGVGTVNQIGFSYSTVTGSERNHKVRTTPSDTISIYHGTMISDGVIRGFITYEAA